MRMNALYRLQAISLIGLLGVGGWSGAQTPMESRADAVSLRAFGNDATARFLKQEKVALASRELSTISAIEAVADGKAELALVSRGAHPANAKEMTLAFDAIAWDAIVVIVHPANPVSNLSLRQVRDIYAGRISRWEQVGGRAEAIHLNAVAGPLDGVEYGLRKALFGRGNIPVAAERWYLNTAQLEAGIMIDPNGLAVSTLSNVQGNAKLKRLSIEGVTATTAMVAAGEYLLVTPLFLVYRKDAAETSGARRFLHFLQSDAYTQIAVAQAKVVPVSQAGALNDMFAVREQKLLAMLADPAPLLIAAETPIMAVVPIAPIKATGKGKKKPDSTAAPTAATAQ